jgi:zinc D-Ala-D-Ala carboxypeptidase
MNLSPHFTLSELIFSQNAVRSGINNAPSSDVIRNLTRLAGVLEQIRGLTGKPVSVSSGYRSPAVNSLTPGSAKNSAHVLGLAADINCFGMSPLALAQLIRDSAIELDQLIYEGAWVHVGLSEGKPRRQVLTAYFVNGKASYRSGIA